MSPTFLRATTLTVFVTASVWVAGHHERRLLAQAPAAPPGGQAPARGGRGGGAPPAPATAQAAATNDLTGYWVRLVTEDWRWLMVVPAKGNTDSIQLTPAGRAVLDAWDPAKDEAAGNQCKGYGAGAISRLPTRSHVTWQDANTLKWETDQGQQTRLFKFNAAAQIESPGERSWQGNSLATWEPSAGGGAGGFPGGGAGGFPGGGAGGFPGGGAGGFPGGAPPVPPPGAGAGPGAAPALPAAPPNAAPVAAGRGGNQNGWLKVVTTNVKSGYLRKNGVPYSDKATITEYFQPTPETYGVRYMIVTTIIEDPEYLQGPLITSSNYKKLPDTNNGWDPQPCSVK
jgi:hypothetical protein